MKSLSALTLRSKNLLALCLLFPAIAFAACSRPIQVPVSATGQSVIIKGEAVSGIYPEMLRGIADKEECNFVFSVVPRARLEAMFESGSADLLIPASKTPRRDELGLFIPLIHYRATLISIDRKEAKRPAIKSAQDLINRRDLRVVLVRGFDYGPAYQALVTELTKQGRIAMEADPTSVARVLKAGTFQLTIMAPSIFAGAIQGDARVEDLLGKLRYEAIDELPWGESGVYISKRSLTDDDRDNLRELLERAANSGVVWKNFQRYYSAEVLKQSIGPRDTAH
ncbi:MAG: transporter substrate-binding domain-containing protein [Undibacterium sp.]|uniref:substrate-binding periplasmic protein n=1 Tax=Undibacterium sp. TaxID=1914977 RepID=UPI0027292990|nr:transporter substrate-binding domain-containing protein [Undibacterium sp.]MDO8652625.1 transporter substrate-binding domain-containing protein [Undibacterium sp.]